MSDTTDDLSDQLTTAYGTTREAEIRVQSLALDYAKALAKEAWPDAHYLELTSSDQSYNHGWVLTAVVDGEGNAVYPDPSDEPEDLWRPLSDLDWRHPGIDESLANHGGDGARIWLIEPRVEEVRARDVVVGDEVQDEDIWFVVHSITGSDVVLLEDTEHRNHDFDGDSPVNVRRLGG